MLGAMALGMATIGLGPALAQSAGSGAAGMGHGIGMTSPHDMPRTGAMPRSGQTSSPTSEGQMGRGEGMNTRHANHARMGATMHEHPMNREMESRMARTDRGHAEVDRLNQESLRAARNHQRFDPSGAR
jgi:hypothetical protein